MSWYAIYTKPRNEKKVYSLLVDKDVESYLPLISRVSQWKDRKKKIEIPLFNSYLFANFDYKFRFNVLETSGIVKIINFNGIPAVVPDWQIESLRKMLEYPTDLKLENYIKLGELVEILDGPMKGLRGSVLNHKGSDRLLLTIDGIKQSLSVEISQTNLKRINSG